MNTRTEYTIQCLLLRRAHCEEFKKLIQNLILLRQILSSKHMEERFLLKKSIHYCTELAKLIRQQTSEIVERIHENDHEKHCLQIQQELEMDALKAIFNKEGTLSY